MNEFLIKISNNLLQSKAEYSSLKVSDILSFFNKPLEQIMNNALVQAAFDVVLPVGIIIMLIYYMVDLMNVAMDDRFNLEYLIKNIVKFIVGYIIVSNVKGIVTGINIFADAIVSDGGLLHLGDVILVDMNTPISYAERINSNNPLTTDEITILGMRMIVEFLFSIFIFLATMFTGFKRAIKIGIYYVLSPIMVADISSKGIYGSIAQIKKIVALFLQYPYVLLCCHVANGIMDAMQNSSHSVLFVVFIILWTLASMINKSEEELTRMFSS